MSMATRDIVFRELKVAAREMRLVTYTDLGKAAGISALSVGGQLNSIHKALSMEMPGAPWLVAIAVGKNRLPGDSLFRGTDLLMDPTRPDHRAWWRAMVAAVFASDWTGVEIGG